MTTSDFNQDISSCDPRITNDPLLNGDSLDNDDREDGEGMNLEASFTENSGGPYALPAIPIRSQSCTPSSSHRAKKITYSTLSSCVNSPGENLKMPVTTDKKLETTLSPSRSVSATGASLKMLIVESMQALNALEGIDGLAYSKAVERFHADYMWMELFLQMTDERKKDWVLNIK